MKKQSVFTLLFLIIGTVISAQPLQINGFDELMDSFTSGYTVKAVIHYGDCSLIIDGEEEEAPDAIGGMELNTFEHFAIGTVKNEKAFVTASETVLIWHPFYGYVLNYAKIRIYDDNSVEVIARYLDPNRYEVKMDETFKTVMNDGENEGAAFFYKN